MVALSESVIKNRLKRPLAEKSWWRHIRLAIKPRYLENHASQINIYYGTLARSCGRSFRIRHEKSPEDSLAEKSQWRHIRLAMKPRYLGNHASHLKSYYRTLSGRHGRSFTKRHKIHLKRPLAEKSWWHYIGWHWNLVISETMHPR